MDNVTMEQIILGLAFALILAIAIILLLIYSRVSIDFKGLNRAIFSFSDLFGVPTMPWIIRVYLVLFVVFGVALLLASILTVSDPFNNVASELFSFSSDSIKLILGAILGSLSLAAERTWVSPTVSTVDAEDQERTIEKEAKPVQNSSKEFKRSAIHKETKSKK
jgi:hypothetical protein